MPATTPTPTHAHAAAPAHDDEALRFDFNGLVSLPYTLHTYFFDLYQGDALLVAGHSARSTHLVVPPNVAAVVLLANGQRVKLDSGKHPLRTLLKYAPVSVQFVNTQLQPFTYTVKMRSWGQLDLEVGLRVLVEVIDPVQVTHWKDPLTDVESLVKQALVAVAANNSYEDCLRKMPEMLNASVRVQVDASCRARGLAVLEMVLTHLEPDKKYCEKERDNKLAIAQLQADIERFKRQRELTQEEAALKEEQSKSEHLQKMNDFEWREAEEKRRREVELLTAQVDEDIAAMKQPSRKREAVSGLNRILGERSFEIRLKAIDALQNIVKTILEERAHYPGQFSNADDTQVLNDALTMLKEWSTPPATIPSPPVRSLLAMDKHPEPPPVAEPIKPDGQTVP